MRIAVQSLLVLLLLGVYVGGQDGSRGAKQGARKAGDFVVEVQPQVIAPGETAVLRWSIKGATRVLIEERSKSQRELREIGKFDGSGSVQVRPKEDTIYVLSCEGTATLSCVSVTVRVRVKER